MFTSVFLFHAGKGSEESSLSQVLTQDYLLISSPSDIFISEVSHSHKSENITGGFFW